jgi:cytochrome P450
MLTELDGPAHAKLRQHIASAFTPRALPPARLNVRVTAAGMLERSVGEPFEFVESLAMPLPILAAFALLGIHPEDQELVYARVAY